MAEANTHDIITKLPKDLLVEVVTKVSSNSIEDHMNVKATCTQFHDAATDSKVYKHVDTSRLPCAPRLCTSNHQLNFFNRCTANGNIGFEFRNSVLDFFRGCNPDEESRVQRLRRAALNGCNDSMYVYSMLLMNNVDQIKRENGLRMYLKLKAHNCLKKWRERARQFIKQIWHIHNIQPIVVPSWCGDTQCQLNSKRIIYEHRHSNPWMINQDDEAVFKLVQCEACLADFELSIFLKPYHRWGYPY